MVKFSQRSSIEKHPVLKPIYEDLASDDFLDWTLNANISKTIKHTALKILLPLPCKNILHRNGLEIVFTDFNIIIVLFIDLKETRKAIEFFQSFFKRQPFCQIVVNFDQNHYKWHICCEPIIFFSFQMTTGAINIRYLGKAKIIEKIDKIFW